MTPPAIKVVAFDCFGTVFDMSPVSKKQILAYVHHVKQQDFSPFIFEKEWYDIQAHPDSAEGIRMLQQAGFTCVTLSNGHPNLLRPVSETAGIYWDRIIDLAGHCSYKPNNLDAYRTVEKETGFRPEQTLMVTANPTFGDVESSAAIGMHCQVIRRPDKPQTIIELAESLVQQQDGS